MKTGNWNKFLFALSTVTLSLVLIIVRVNSSSVHVDGRCDNGDRQLCMAVCGNDEPEACVEAPTDNDFNFYCICTNKISKTAIYKNEDEVSCSPANKHSKNGCSCPVDLLFIKRNHTFDCQIQDYQMCACALSAVELVETPSNYEDFDTEGDADFE